MGNEIIIDALHRIDVYPDPVNTLNPYVYDNYRVFIKDALALKKERNLSYSNRGFAKKAAISPSFLSLILDGSRNLSPEMISKIAFALELNQEEKHFFHDLVLFNQSKLTEEKNFHFQNMSKHKRFKEVKVLEKRQFEYFSKWYHSAIRELVTFENFKNDPEWISNTLIPKISSKQAAESFDLLIQLGLIEKNTQGKWVQTNAVITSGEGFRSLAIRNYHIEMLHSASRSIDHIDRSERDLTSLTFTLDNEQFKWVKKEITEFRKMIISKLVEKKQTPKKVYQLGLQLFPLTQQEPPEEKPNETL